MPAKHTNRQWAPLYQPLFRNFWIAAFASNIGSWMQNVAAAWLMTALSPSPLLAALIQTAGTLPLFLFGLPAGALADLASRRRVLLWTQTGNLLSALALAMLAFTGHAGPWTLLLLTFILGVCTAWSAPAWAATIPTLVQREDLPSAVTLNSVQFNAARAVGPALGGLLLVATSPSMLFLLNAASFLAVIGVVAKWRDQEPVEHANLRFGSFIAEGLRFVRGDATMRMVLRRAFGFVMTGSALWALLPSIARHSIQTSGGGFGVMLGALGLGAVLAGVLLSRRRRNEGVHRMLLWGTCGFMAATGLLAFCSTGDLLLAIPVLLLGGMAWMAVMSTLNVAAQSALPDPVRARGLSIYIVLFNGTFAFGSWFWGQFAERLPLRYTLWTAAAGLALSLVLASLRDKRPVRH